MNKNINVGLIGFGMAGKVFHAPIIANVEGLCLRKIFERKEANVKIINNIYPKAIVVSEVREILEDEEIDLVIVATTNATHFSLAKAALEAGKHVVVEKPFTTTVNEADELIALAIEKNRILTVHQNRRWDSDFKTIKKVVESGLLGNIVEYEVHYDRFRNVINETWKEKDTPGTGLLYDLGSHLIDQAQCIFGMPSSISGDLRKLRENGKINDNFEVILNYDKTKVTLKAGLLVKEVGPHFVLHGDKGSFIKYGMDVQEEALKKGLTPNVSDAWGIEPDTLWGTINTTHMGLNIKGKIESEKGDYCGFYENVRDAISGKKKLNVLPDQARNTINLIEQATKSSNEKKTIIL